MTENNINDNNGDNVKEIDLLELAKKIWDRRRMVIKWCAVGAVIGIIVAFSIPKTYVTSVKLAPEKNDGKSASANLGALAAMAGVSIGNSGSDAIYPKLYPDIVQSVPFCTSLFNVPLVNAKGDKHFTVAEYFENETRSPWWSAILGAPGKLLGALRSNDDEKENKNHKLNTFRLTAKESGLVSALQGTISTDVDIKTNVVTISVKTQDPMVSALLADTVVSRLQEYVTAYRTDKARKDLEYVEKLNEEARADYYAAQQKLANYLDTHQGMVLYSAQTTRDRLENEATLAFNLFNQTSQQLQVAKAKVQEDTPVYARIMPATVPIRAAGPKKIMILGVFIFLAFLAASAWILVVDPLRKKQRQNSAAQDKE